MPEELGRRPRPKYCRVPSRRRIRPPINGPNPVATRRPVKARIEPLRILSRSASEPILPSLPSISVSNDDAAANRDHSRSFFFSSSSSSSLFPSPSPPRSNFMEEAKVVVSVTVEGSPGPVRAMVKLGSTVDEAIGVVVEKYKREGRSPSLDSDRDRASYSSFELHHSHFSLQSLNKNDKIGETGSRSFYLRKSCSNNSFNSGSEGIDSIRGTEIELLDARLQAIPPPPAHVVFSFIAGRLSKIRRRTKRLWRVVTCDTCV